MLQKFNESDFELLFLERSRFSYLVKFSSIKSPFFFRVFYYAYFFFHFCNIVLIDVFYIQRFFLILWLFVGCLGFVSKFKSILRLGKYYYHFLVKYFLTRRKFFFFLSFLLDDVLKAQFSDGLVLKKSKFVLLFNNLKIFTNKKLARGVYFYRVNQKLFLKIQIVREFFNYYLYFLNSLKLYVIT